MKKILACMLSVLIFLGSSIINVSAAQASQLEKTNVIQSNNFSNQVDQSLFGTIYPGDVKFDGVSVSVIEYAMSAYRETNGSVTVYINETLHTTRGYYEHLATDSSGDNFLPSKNTAYYTHSEGIHSINLPSDSVSADGYVYFIFALAPEGAGQLFNQHKYNIPVDYDQYSTANSNFNILDEGVEFIASFSAQLATFDAKATRQADNTVEVFINLKSTNTKLWFRHYATSKYEDIFIPQKDTWYHLTSGPQSNRSYRFILSENSVSKDFVYLEAQFDLPFGMADAGSIKLPIKNF